MRSADLRLRDFLTSRHQPGEPKPLTADASTREYFRVEWGNKTAIACVYPEAFEPASQTYLDVTRVFLAGGLPVPETLDVDGPLGVIIQEDLGDRILRDDMEGADVKGREQLLDEAIDMIARIQAATPIAYDMDSISSQLKFDRDKLGWELDFFKTHYFGTYLKRPLSTEEDRSLTAEFADIVGELDTLAAVLCHRDFHAANLMIDLQGRMRIIDHQDARIGSASYDLVSLLLDRIVEMPTLNWVASRQRYFLEQRARLGLDAIDPADFAHQFNLQTIQRCLKAVGTFSFQSVNRGKTYFIPFIKPMFRISLRAAESLDRFPCLRETVLRELS
jgi:N-acetylmuramate 1-kinase